MTTLEVVSPGLLSLVQDLGRHGWVRLGVGESGAFDRAALRLANRLVGNREGAAAVETLGPGLVLRATGSCVVAVTGAEGALTLVRNGRPQPAARRSPLHLLTGDEIAVGTTVGGVRTYVAVRGGLRVGATLGSMSRDTLARLGPEPLAAGDVLPLGSQAVANPLVDHAPLRRRSGPLHVLLGPRDDWFTDDAVRILLTTRWSVSSSADRVGVRLDGPALPRRDPGHELPSEPVVTGALQVPPDGRPVLLGPDHPTTGGYPVIAVVTDADVDRVAQLGPGDTLTFTDVRSP